MSFQAYAKKYGPFPNITPHSECLDFINNNEKKFAVLYQDLEAALRLIWLNGNQIHSEFGGDWEYEERKYRGALKPILEAALSNTVAPNIGSQTWNTIRSLELYAAYLLKRAPVFKGAKLEITFLKPKALGPLFSSRKRFERWLAGTGRYSQKSVTSYASGLGAILSELAETPLFGIEKQTKFEEVKAALLENPIFVSTDTAGNQMYSGALNLYSEFLEAIASSSQEFELRGFDDSFSDSQLLKGILAKPFTILIGASGTGKTKVAESLAKALVNEDGSNSAVVAVGSDWADSRNVLGFVNHLREGEDKLPIYQSTPILDLLLEAGAEGNEDLPYFLILDEMNLSHVERYFADFLSAMERSEGELALHQEGDDSTRLQRSPEQEGDVPQSLPYPQNLFVIGTVNIDETTYMFSPKVLDRANVIEFAVDSDDIGSFLAEPKDYEMAEKASAGVAEGFLALAKQGRQLKDGLEGLPEGPKGQVDGHLLALFKILKAHRYEYGYRTAAEVTKYLRVCRHLADDKTKWDAEGWQGSLDEQIVQKLLPKLHGSVGRIGDLLAVLGCYCYNGSEKENSRLNDLLNLKEGVGLFPKSFAKLQSMAQTLRDEQFVSFIQ